jgi:putative Mg2+ transporter-C (MgtC) family protein
MEQFQSFLSYLQSFNSVTVLIRLLLAVIAGGIIGNERGRHGRAAGLRTHILICLGGAMTSLCSLYVSQVSGLGGDIFRIPASVVSGIGFLGAGIIMVKNNSTIAGLTTAAGMWVTGTIGVAFGFGFYGGALLATVICVVNAALLTKVEHKRKQAVRFYIEIDDLQKIQEILNHITTILEEDLLVETVNAKSGIVGRIGFVVSTSYKKSYEEIRKSLIEIDGVSFVVEE